MIATSYQGLLYLPHFVCTLLRLLALETCYMQGGPNRFSREIRISFFF